MHQKGGYRFQERERERETISFHPSKHCYSDFSFLESVFVLFDSLQHPCSRSDRALGVFRHCMHGSSGCLGCYNKPTLITTLDVPSKGLKKQGKAVKKPSTSEDFWTTSTHDMDNSAVQSQGSISSTSVTNQALDPHSGSGKSSNPTEFVNHGLIFWNQTRQHWVGNKKPLNQTPQLREPKLSTYCLCLGKHLWLCSWNATYESLLGSSKPFPQSVPLSEMVDFLVDIWEQEGMYD